MSTTLLKYNAPDNLGWHSSDLNRYLRPHVHHLKACSDSPEIDMCSSWFALGFSALATSAMAADLPRKAPPAPVQPVQAVNWTGLYVGVHGGYSWGKWEGDLTFDPGGGPIEVFDPAHRTIDGHGWLAGGQVGFNYQIDGRLDWFGTVRGRAGVAFDRFLIYATGGAAFGQSKADLIVTNIIPCCLVTATASAKENHVGWTAGAGVEWMYSRNWSIKAEYLHVDLGAADYHFVGTTFV